MLSTVLRLIGISGWNPIFTDSAPGCAERVIMIDSCYRLLKGMRNYGRLIPLLYQRTTHAAVIDVLDRRTGLRFKCRRGADTMLAETFHALIYNIPFAPIRNGDIIFDVGA